MGTRSASTELKLSFSSTIKNTLPDGGVASANLGKTIVSGALDNGVSEGESNRAWVNLAETISSGGSIDIDLYDLGTIDIGAGAGKDALGQDMVLEEIVCLIIKQTAGPGRLEIMATNPTGFITWLPAQTVANGGALRPNGVRAFYETDESALDISDGVSHVLRLGANGGDVTYEIYVAGRNDDNESSSSSSSSLSSQSSSSSSLSSASSNSSSSSSTSP